MVNIYDYDSKLGSLVAVENVVRGALELGAVGAAERFIGIDGGGNAVQIVPEINYQSHGDDYDDNKKHAEYAEKSPRGLITCGGNNVIVKDSHDEEGPGAELVDRLHRDGALSGAYRYGENLGGVVHNGRAHGVNNALVIYHRAQYFVNVVVL